MARQRIRTQSRKKGRTPKDTTLFWAGWVLVFTTVAPALLGAETISALYRVRWQIELAIKRWKSVLDVGKLRAKEGSPVAEVWLLGKLLYAMVVERRARRHLGADWSRLDGERRGTLGVGSRWRLATPYGAGGTATPGQPDQLGEKRAETMAKPPHRGGEMRGFYPVSQVIELAAGYRYTTLRLDAQISVPPYPRRGYSRPAVPSSPARPGPRPFPPACRIRPPPADGASLQTPWPLGAEARSRLGQRPCLHIWHAMTL